jgi:hypothetical protein
VNAGEAGGARRDEDAADPRNAYVAGRRGAQPERTNVTVSDHTDDDAAAVLTVLIALAGSAADPEALNAPPRSVWAAPAARGWAPGPHAWWASGLVR